MEVKQWKVLRRKCPEVRKNVNELVANPDSYGTHGGVILFMCFEYSW